MKRYLLSAALLILFAAQTMTTAWAAAATISMAAATATSDCAGHDEGMGEDFPCCPDGMMQVAGCSAVCSLAAMGPALDTVAYHPCRASSVEFLVLPIASQTYSPVNPPPIY